MANYTPNDIYTAVADYVKAVPTASMQYVAFDQCHSAIWRAYPWSWTLKTLTAIALVDGTQDYTVADSDYMRLVNARITKTDITPHRFQELSVTKFLPPELNVKKSWGNFKLISWNQATQKMRLEGAAQVDAGSTYQIDGEYQYTPTKQTSSTWSTSLLFPDWYVSTFVEGYLYYLYKFTDDSRAGGVVTDGQGNHNYSGQLAKFYNELNSMAMSEDSNAGQQFVFPSDPIGMSMNGRVINIYGQ